MYLNLQLDRRTLNCLQWKNLESWHGRYGNVLIFILNLGSLVFLFVCIHVLSRGNYTEFLKKCNYKHPVWDYNIIYLRNSLEQTILFRKCLKRQILEPAGTSCVAPSKERTSTGINSLVSKMSFQRTLNSKCGCED